jgi:hypothetical protein
MRHVRTRSRKAWQSCSMLCLFVVMFSNEAVAKEFYKEPSFGKAAGLLLIMLLIYGVKLLYERIIGEDKSKKVEAELDESEREEQKRLSINIHIIEEQLRAGNIEIVKSEEYSIKEKRAANLLLKEAALIEISELLEKALGKLTTSEEQHLEAKKIISSEYKKLGHDNKHELLPLILSGDMKEEVSTYIEDKDVETAVRQILMNLFKKENLDFEALKQAYVSENHYSQYLPLRRNINAMLEDLVYMD